MITVQASSVHLTYEVLELVDAEDVVIAATDRQKCIIRNRGFYSATIPRRQRTVAKARGKINQYTYLLT